MAESVRRLRVGREVRAEKARSVGNVGIIQVPYVDSRLYSVPMLILRLQPIFHEGSKGYLCCKRRVLDFDDFLNMPGCRYTTHLFVGHPKAETEEEEMVDCRLDHYQTPTQVIVSAFAKG